MAFVDKNKLMEKMNALLEESGEPSIAAMVAGIRQKAQTATNDAVRRESEAKNDEAAATSTYNAAVAAAHKAFDESMKTVSAKRIAAATIREKASKMEDLTKYFG